MVNILISALLLGLVALPDVGAMKGPGHGMRWKKHPGCKGSPDCKTNVLKCMSAIMGAGKEDQCAKQTEMEDVIEGCVMELEMQDAFQTYYEAEGQYVMSPYMYFMKELKRTEPMKEMELRCCTFKTKGIVNEDNTVNVDAMVKMFMENAGDDKMLQDAITVGQKECPVPSDCQVMEAKKCFMNQCIRSLSTE